MPLGDTSQHDDVAGGECHARRPEVDQRIELGESAGVGGQFSPERNEDSRGDRLVPGLAKEAVLDVDLHRVVGGGFGHAAGSFFCGGSLGRAAPGCAVT